MITKYKYSVGAYWVTMCQGNNSQLMNEMNREKVCQTRPQITYHSNLDALQVMTKVNKKVDNIDHITALMYS